MEEYNQPYNKPDTSLQVKDPGELCREALVEIARWADYIDHMHLVLSKHGLLLQQEEGDT